MKLARIVGTVVGAVHHPAYDGHKLLLCQPVDEAGAAAGTSFVAVDVAQAGVGDLVLVNQEGNSAGELLRRAGFEAGIPPGEKRPPVRSVVIGIVDRVDL